MNPVACQPPVANSSLPMRTIFHSRSTFETILRTRHVGTKGREEERESGGGGLDGCYTKMGFRVNPANSTCTFKFVPFPRESRLGIRGLQGPALLFGSPSTLRPATLVLSLLLCIRRGGRNMALDTLVLQVIKIIQPVVSWPRWTLISAMDTF